MNRPGPYFLMMDVTLQCNNRCRFCNVWSQPQPNALEVEKTSYEILESRLKEAWKLGCRAVCFAGGEPTLYRDLGKLVSEVQEIGYFTEIITNGIILKPEPWVKKVDAYAISYTSGREAFEKTRGLPIYDLVKSNLESAVEYGVKVYIFDMLNVDTLPHVDETAEYAKRLGVKLHIFSVTEQKRMGYGTLDWNGQRPANVFSEMERIKKKYGRDVAFWREGEAFLDGIGRDKGFRCQIADSTVSVKPNGSVKLPCSNFPKISSTPGESLAGFWDSDVASYARKMCGHFDFCEGCLHQYCNYHVSLLGRPRKSINWFLEAI